MNILMIVPRFYPAIGGMENHALAIAEYFQKKGDQVTVFTSTSKSYNDINYVQFTPPFFVRRKEKVDLKLEETYKGIKIRRFPIRFRAYSLNWIPGLVQRLKKDIQKYDVVHGFGFNHYTMVQACKIAKKKKVPFVLSGLDLGIAQNTPLVARAFKKVYDTLWGRYLCKNSTKLVGLTEDHRPEYVRLGAEPEKIGVSLIGLELEQYKLKGQEKELRKKYELSSGPLLLSVGRLEEHKGVQDVIRMMPSLKAKHAGLQLAIVGEDQGYGENLKKLAEEVGCSEDVIFTGKIPREDIFSFYENTDVFVFPSKMEGFGIVMIEAMTYGTPCVGYTIPAVRTIIKNAQNGFLVDTAEEFEQRLGELLKNSELREQLGKNAKTYAKQFSNEAVGKRFESMYEESIQGIQ